MGIFMSRERQNKKILQITKAKFPTPSAIRVVKEGLSLAESGYQTAVLCPPFENQEEYEVWNGIEIFRPKILGRRPILDKILMETLFFSPRWYRAIKKIIEVYMPDVLHVHDIWLGRVSFAACSTQKIVMDLHENMPAAVMEHPKNHTGIQRWFLLCFHGRQRVFAYEKRLLLNSNLVFAVVEEAKERIISEHKQLSCNKVVSITNFESKRFIKSHEVGNASFKKDHFSVLYIGGFASHRGLDTLIRAMVHVRDSSENIKVQLIGAQPSQYLDILKRLITQLAVQDYVRITGWINSEDVLANILQADVCCVPHHSNSHTDNTIPHKLFQYMIAKRPVLVSSSPPLARIVGHANAGMIFEAGNPVDCARKIISMSKNKLECEIFAENGFRYVMEQGHNWEEESALNLIRAYDELLTD